MLLIDGDMRRGQLYRFFTGKREGGLSEVLSGSLKLADAVRSSKHKNVSFLSSGTFPPNPSELLVSDRFTEVMQSASETYDVVVIDTPPILSITDAMIIAPAAGIFFVVLESKRHHLGEIRQALKRLDHNGVRAQGVIMNKVQVSMAGYGYGGYRYSYQYKY